MEGHEHYYVIRGLNILLFIGMCSRISAVAKTYWQASIAYPRAYKLHLRRSALLLWGIGATLACLAVDMAFRMALGCFLTPIAYLLPIPLLWSILAMQNLLDNNNTSLHPPIQAPTIEKKGD